MNKTLLKNKIRIAASALAVLVVVSGVWLYGLMNFVKTIPTSITENSSRTDGIVILTGGSGRLDAAINLLNNNKAEKLLISGVSKETNLITILILSGELPDNIAQLLPRIEIGYEAQNTRGNAHEAAKWIKQNNYNSIRMVTANYHINRSLAEFKEYMPEIEIIAHPVIPENFSLDKWWKKGHVKKIVISEYNKFILSKLNLLVS